ncbi:metallophosphoesterase family protein [Sporosarcina gallistercoris]|uniref:Metallophosphoesterase family protein n=1 Tax=Sporosarcina gallistercoris TaxID=2762245 RepID=A0ABR8PFH2_9BACL|nr:metallophosphoesterase family protein [Sporosarcina gallistercoris]MBD7906913.1 metallophosphoesterase family protein [Sporosarcina gallistercoris]
MKVAFISDIHSSLNELKMVLEQIETVAPEAKIVGLGDLFECTIGKKKLDGTTYPLLSEVMLNPVGFEQLLDFPSIRGNQEERIQLISRSAEPLLQKITQLPERMRVGEALLIHGHQWPYNELPPEHVTKGESLVVHGHTHKSSWAVEGEEQKIQFFKLIELPQKAVTVNVGSIVDNKEWVLYDDKERTMTFMKVQQE